MTSPPERLEGTVDPKLLEILVCPVTKGPLEFDAARRESSTHRPTLLVTVITGSSAFADDDDDMYGIARAPLRSLQRLALQQPRHLACKSCGLADEYAF